MNQKNYKQYQRQGKRLNEKWFFGFCDMMLKKKKYRLIGNVAYFVWVWPDEKTVFLIDLMDHIIYSSAHGQWLVDEKFGSKFAHERCRIATLHCHTSVIKYCQDQLDQTSEEEIKRNCDNFCKNNKMASTKVLVIVDNLKKLGNIAYKSHLLETAANHYDSGVNHMISIKDKNHHEKKLLATLYFNLSAVSWSKKNYLSTINYCDLALQYYPKYDKAKLRKEKSLSMLKKNKQK